MPTPGTNRLRVVLMVVAVASVALAGLSYRVLNAAAATAAKPVPAADVQSLSAYLAPLPDTMSLAVSANGSMVGEPDPFGTPAPIVRAPGRGTIPTGSATTVRASQPWVVSSILFQDSKRSAIVNNAWVSVGDLVDGGARITAIERKYVVVTDAKGNRLVVPIKGGDREN